jgi:hypothetical protein
MRAKFAWRDALYHDVPRLRELGWDVEIAPDFPICLLTGDDSFDATLRESSGVDWLELDLGVIIDGEVFDLVEPIIAMIATPEFDRALFSAGAEDDGEAVYLRLPDGRF